MEKRLKGISVFGVFVLLSLVSCGQNDVISVAPKSDSTPEIVSTKTKDNSSTEERAVKSISLQIDKQYLKVGEKAKITADVLPIDATDKTLTFESSDIEVASVTEEGEVIAVSEGKATITAYSKDKKVKGTIDVYVIVSQQDVLNFLNEAKAKERSDSTKGSVVDANGNSYEFHAYTDGAQTKRTTAEDTITVLNLSHSSVVHSLTLTSSDVTAEDLEINKDIDEETAKDSTSMLEYYLPVDGTQTSSKIYGLTSIAINYLTGDYFGTKEALSHLSISKIDSSYSISTYISGVEDTYLLNNMDLGFDKEKRLTSLEITLAYYSSADFDANQGKPKDNVSPKQKKTIKGSLEYGARVETDDFKLNESDYKVKSFQIDTSKFKKENGKNIMYLNQSFPVSVTNEDPKIHLKDTYSIDSFSPTGIVTEDNNYFTARSIGTTTMTVTSSLGRTASIEIEVRKRPVESISFVGSVSSLKVGESVSLSAYCSPYEVKDSPYSMKLKSDDQKAFASLTKDDKNPGSYILKGIKEGEVTVVAYPDENPSITAEMKVKVEGENKGEAPSSNLLKTLTSSPYIDTYASVTFKEDGTGTLLINMAGKHHIHFLGH